jgi:hypothetical protein
MTPVIAQSNVLLATTTCANLTILFVDLVDRPDKDGDVSFSSMDLLKHQSFPCTFSKGSDLLLPLLKLFL